MGRYLMLKKETVYGTPVAPDISMRILSESLAFDPGNTYFRTIEGDREIQSRQAARILSGGGWRMHPVYNKGVGEILLGLLGVIASVNSEPAVRWTHTITPKPDLATAWPSFTVEKGLDALTGERYGGLGISRLRITANAADFVTWDLDTFAKKPVTNAQLTPTHSTQDYMEASQINTQTLGGTTVKFEEFNADIVGGAIPIFKPGSKEIDSIDYVPLEVTGSFTTRFNTTADLTDFLTNTYNPALVYKWKGPALGTDFFSLQLDLFKLIINAGDVNVNQQERLMQVRNFTAIDDLTNGTIKFTLVDDVATH